MSAKNRLSLSEMTVQDVLCPICLSILIEPVTMPCSHSLCMPCFNQNVAETALSCPLCRMRISVWVRRATKSNRLINTRLWQMIKEKFPAKVEARMQGVEESDDEESANPAPRVCAPGEIRQEYEALLQMELKEIASRRSQEEEASSKLIQQLQEEEKMKLRQRKAMADNVSKEDELLAQQIREAENLVLEQKLREVRLLCGSDEEIARRIEKEERTKGKQPAKVAVTPTRGPMDIYVGQKTPRSHGKLLLPDTVRQSPSSMSSLIKSSSKSPGRQCSSPKMVLDYRNTSSSSFSTASFFSRSGGSKSEHFCNGSISRTSSGSSSDSTDRILGRQLREITSSQSSESESEDLLTAQMSKNRRMNRTVPGKENVENSENKSPRKLGNQSRSSSCSPNKGERKKKKSKLFKYKGKSLDISEAELASEEALTSFLFEDSDETDIEEDEEDPEFTPKSLSKRKLSASKGLNKMEISSDQGEGLCDEPEKSFDTEVKNRKSLQCDEDDGGNSSMDYGLLFSDEMAFAESLERMKAEQQRIEEQMKQEAHDRLLAQELQKQMDHEARQVDRSRGSEDEYSLRNRRAVASSSKASSSGGSASSKRERQTTLAEALSKRHKSS